MKNSLIKILLLCLLFASCKQEKNPNQENKQFSLEATITNIPDSTLFYLKPVSNVTIDSAYIINGHLSLKGQLKSNKPELLTLLATNPEFIYTQLMVGNENVQFKVDKNDFPWNIDVSGSVHQDMAEKFNKVIHQKQVLEAELRATYNTNNELLSEKIKTMTDSLDDVTLSLIRDNFNSYAALRHFQVHRTTFSNIELGNLYNKLDDELKQTEAGKAIKLQSEFSKPEVGDTYYDYRAINQNGDTTALSDIKNKYTLLHFSSLACYGSQLSLPDLKKIYKDNSDKIEIVSISTDVNKEQWQSHIKRDSIPWRYLWDGKGNYNNAYIKYWEVGTPNFVLISPDKVILERWFGYREGIFEEKLGKHF